MAENFASMALQTTLAQIQAGSVHDDDYRGLVGVTARDDPVVVDVGANRGQSIASLKHLFPNSTIHAFEPNSLFFSALDRLADTNRDAHTCC
jgi:hypothetical protein